MLRPAPDLFGATLACAQGLPGARCRTPARKTCAGRSSRLDSLVYLVLALGHVLPLRLVTWTLLCECLNWARGVRVISIYTGTGLLRCLDHHHTRKWPHKNLTPCSLQTHAPRTLCTPDA